MDARTMLFGPQPYTSPCLETAPRRSLVEIRQALLVQQIELTQRHYAALLELQTVRDELTAVERRLAMVDAADCPDMRVIGSLDSVTGG